MEVIVVVAIVSSLSALVVSIGTHFKHSECCKGMLSCDTRTPPQSPNVIVSTPPSPQVGIKSTSI